MVGFIRCIKTKINAVCFIVTDSAYSRKNSLRCKTVQMRNGELSDPNCNGKSLEPNFDTFTDGGSSSSNRIGFWVDPRV